MRTLLPPCDLIIFAVAANDMHHLDDIVDTVGEPVKNRGRKLNVTNNKGHMVLPNPAIPPGQVFMHGALVQPGARNEGAAATTIGNPGQPP